MEEIIKKYEELYADMATAKDPKKMMVFGEAEKKIFHSLAEKHPELAEMWLGMLESGRWNNYLSEEEAEEIVESLMEKQGDRYVQRHEWDYPILKSAVLSMGGKVSEEPYYNCWALWATMNMLYSDHAETAREFVQPSNMRVKFFYKLALDKLKDFDRPRFVREYFHLH
jgi:hypothetical protein